MTKSQVREVIRKTKATQYPASKQKHHMYCKIIENVKRKKVCFKHFKATKKAKLSTFKNS